MTTQRIAGYSITSKQLAALHGLYRGLIKTRDGQSRVYGTNVTQQLQTLADRGIITRTGMGAYMIQWDSPGAQIIDAMPTDFTISSNSP